MGRESHPFLVKTNMSVKKYIASSTLHLNVVLKSGKNRHVSFIPNSNGKSFLIADDPDLQEALERNVNFGKLFFLAAAFPKTVVFLDEDQNSAKDAERSVQEKKEAKKVVVSDLATAREYLADNFNVSRTKIKTKSQIVACASTFGIEFVGVE